MCRLERPTVSMQRARAIAPDLVRIRRTLHQYPEIGFEVHRTAELIVRQLQALGIPFCDRVGKTGVIGLIEGTQNEPVVALRADLDALPIAEESETSYASRVEGVMHACGHDLHTVCLLGAAQLLVDLRKEIPGSVRLIFQPAEEIDEGAREMIADGVLEDPRVSAIIGLHNFPGLPTGSIAVRHGPLMASTDTFSIQIKGEGGHAAIPDQAVDALVAAASIVLQLQTIVSRNISPLDEAVVSVGILRAGTADNVVADRAELRGTVRSLDPEVRVSLHNLIDRIVEGSCFALGVVGSLKYTPSIPILMNDQAVADAVSSAGMKLLGSEAVKTAERTMGSEDFALYLEHVPGCYFWLGATSEDSPTHSWHHPRFDIDEAAIPIGMAVLAQSCLDYLATKERE